MPIDNSGEGLIRVETNVGGEFVNLEDTNFREWQYGRNQQREPRIDRLNRQAVEASQSAPEEQVEAPKPRKKRRTKAQIEADKKRDQKLTEAHEKDLKDKNIR